MSNQTKGIIYACVTAFMWGFLAIALKVAVRKVDPVTIVWMRFSIAFSILLLWNLIKSPKALKILYKPPLLLIIASLGLAWNYMGFMLGIHYTSPSNTQIAIQAGPVILTLVGIIFYKEYVSKYQVLGFALVVLGFLTFYNQQVGIMIGQEEQYTKGMLLTLSGAIAWAVFSSLQKKLVPHYSVATLNLFVFGFSAILYVPFVDFSLLSELQWLWWLLLVFLGLNTLIAYGCLSMALKYIEASKVSMIIILNPIITFVVMGILTILEVTWISGERFTFLSLLGAVVVLTGAILVVRKKKAVKA